MQTNALFKDWAVVLHTFEGLGTVGPINPNPAPTLNPKQAGHTRSRLWPKHQRVGRTVQGFRDVRDLRVFRASGFWASWGLGVSNFFELCRAM